MRTLLASSVLLAACGAPPPASTPARDATGATPTASAPGAPASGAPGTPAPYVLPPAVARALASEALAGNVLVPSAMPLAPTADAARAAITPRLQGQPIAMRVVRDHGDVVEVDTAPADDCAGSFPQPYALTVFVRRAALIPRTTTERTASYPDGTGVAIDRGAPVRIGAAGLTWMTAALAGTAVRPSADQLAYAVPPGNAPAALPALAGERLICDGEPQTLAAWREEQQREREAEQGATGLSARGSSDDERFLRWCSVGERDDEPGRASPPPTVNGATLAWPDRAEVNAHVVKAGGDRYLGDVGVRCGRIRYAVTAEGVRRGGGGIGTLGGRKPVLHWIPRPGKVTWPDGSPAGSFRGGRRYRDAEEVGDRICVEVATVAARVCHPKQTTPRELALPSFDD